VNSYFPQIAGCGQVERFLAIDECGIQLKQAKVRIGNRVIIQNRLIHTTLGLLMGVLNAVFALTFGTGKKYFYSSWPVIPY
jgi:hypothetical protein